MKNNAEKTEISFHYDTQSINGEFLYTQITHPQTGLYEVFRTDLSFKTDLSLKEGRQEHEKKLTERVKKFLSFKKTPLSNLEDHMRKEVKMTKHEWYLNKFLGIELESLTLQSPKT